MNIMLCNFMLFDQRFELEDHLYIMSFAMLRFLNREGFFSFELYSRGLFCFWTMALDKFSFLVLLSEVC